MCSSLRDLGVIVMKVLIYTNMSGASPETLKVGVADGRGCFCSLTSVNCRQFAFQLSRKTIPRQAAAEAEGQ